MLLISETHAGPLRTWLDNFRPSSLFILDEAHHAAPSSGGPLSEGDVQGTRVTCPWHSADFDLKTGAVLGICYKQVQAPATHYITLNGHSVERTSRRAHGSVLSALPTLGEPGMGPNVVQEPFLRCASQSFKRRRKRLVAWILHLSATDPLLATIRRNDPGRDAADWLWKRITSRQSCLTRSDIDAGTKTLALTLVHFSGAGLSPYKTRKSISARQRARERLAATRRKSTRHLNPSLDFFQCPGMKCTLRRAFTFAGL